jgi:uncharacterized protein
MRLNISDIPEDGLQQDIELPITVNDNVNPDIAHVNLRVLKLGRKVLIEGSVKISASLTCSRCLKEFSHPLDMTFRDVYNPSEEIETEPDHELSNNELDLSFYSSDEIEISELVKEQVLLSVPMKPLCKLQCRGICPRCGKDLNMGTCQCKTEEIDPRLAPLKRLKELTKDRKE